MTNAEIVSIGSELLLGQIVDTNATWLAQRLTEVGINLFYKTVVGDNPARMQEVVGQALERSDVVITGGGLGPTQDDLTREAIAEVTGRRLVLDNDLLEQIEARFRQRGLILTPNNERQAYIPEGAITVENPNGTAPSFIVEDNRGVVISLPGVPFEMKWLFDNEMIPYLRKKFKLSETISYRILKLANVGESSVDQNIGHLITNSHNPTVGVLAHPGQVDVRIGVKAASEEQATRLIAPVEEEVRRLLGQHIFAMDDETIETVVGSLLRRNNLTIASCEDLTGGLVAERLQQASSEHFIEGIVGNSVSSLSRLLAFCRHPNQASDLLNDSEALTEELAWATRARVGSNLGLALHTVHDKNDHTENLARGQTFLCVTDGKSSKTRTYQYGGRGLPDRTRVSLNAMDLVRVALMEGIVG